MLQSQLTRYERPSGATNYPSTRNIEFKIPGYKEKNPGQQRNKIVLMASVKFLKRMKNEGKITEEQFSAVMVLLISKFIEGQVAIKISNVFDRMIK